MQLRFLHTADLHLGYEQYGLAERYNDFTEAFQWVVDTALEERVDFLLIAGDLFEKRALDPRTLYIAVDQFERLKDAGIPVVAIEGNHERTYGESLSWMEFLNLRGLLHLLDCTPGEQHGWLPQPWDDAERTGGYVDLAGARIYGLKYRGEQTGRLLSNIGAAIAAAQPPDAESNTSPASENRPQFSIFMSHTSVEGYFDQGHAFADLSQLNALRPNIDYLALGHVHTPYRGALGEGDWLFNPGCPETWSSKESQYGDRGAILVEVDVADYREDLADYRADVADYRADFADYRADTTRTPAFKATVRNYPNRRPFIRIRQEMDACPSPARLMELLDEKMQREPAPNANALHEPKAPVVEVVLTGVARFSRTEIENKDLEQMAKQHFAPLIVRTRSSLQEAPASLVEGSEELDRHVLERMVFENLVRADDRFAPAAAKLAQVATLLKQMALDGASANDIAEEASIRVRTQRQAAQDDVDPAIPALSNGPTPQD